MPNGENVGRNTQKNLSTYVLLFAIFPILFLFSHNVGLVSWKQILIPIVITMTVALLLVGALRVIVKDKPKSGIFVSFLMVWLFSYGHLFTYLTNMTIGGVGLGQHKYVIIVWGIVLLVCGSIILITRRDLGKFVNFLNIMSMALIGITVANLIYGVMGRNTIRAEGQTNSTVGLEMSNKQPDIYYIVLDACTRADILEEMYQSDVTVFNRRLTDMGFFIANQSRANYSQTQLSIASTLNFTYLDELVDHVDVESSNRLPLRNLIHHSRVIDLLRQQGYLFIAFSTGIDNTEIKGADRYITNRWALSEFHNVLLNSTPIPGLVNRLLTRSSNFQYEAHRDRVLYTFDHLPDMARIEKPTFTFAHIMACHPPFVFGENGEYITSEEDFGYNDGNFFRGEQHEYIEGYRRQVAFINKKIEETVEAILANSPEPPIIIIQGDHGPGSMLDFYSLENSNLRERMSIFSAYFLPDGGNELLYDDITPVNTFRVIFNHYFGTDFDLLEDESFFSTIDKPYKLTNITYIIDDG